MCHPVLVSEFLTHLDHVHGIVVGVGVVVGLPVGVDVDPVEVVVVLVQVVLHVDHQRGQAHHKRQEMEGIGSTQQTLRIRKYVLSLGKPLEK